MLKLVGTHHTQTANNNPLIASLSKPVDIVDYDTGLFGGGASE